MGRQKRRGLAPAHLRVEVSTSGTFASVAFTAESARELGPGRLSANQLAARISRVVWLYQATAQADGQLPAKADYARSRGLTAVQKKKLEYGPFRKPLHARRTLIWALADIYEGNTGRPARVSYNHYEGKDADYTDTQAGDYSGPFFRFVKQILQHIQRVDPELAKISGGTVQNYLDARKAR